VGFSRLVFFSLFAYNDNLNKISKINIYLDS